MIRIEFDVVLKQFKVNALILLFSDILDSREIAAVTDKKHEKR